MLCLHGSMTMCSKEACALPQCWQYVEQGYYTPEQGRNAISTCVMQFFYQCHLCISIICTCQS